VACRVFWACSIETMWKQKYQARLSEPFGFRAHYILINNKLSWIVKITELCFPLNEVFRTLKWIPIFVAHNTEFIKVGIVNLESSFWVLFHKLTINKGSGFFTWQLLTMEYCMSLWECTSFNIFTWQSYIVPIN